MISKNKIKLIRSLEQKKFRKEWQLFVAEGHKLVDDLLPAFDCAFLAARKEWLDTRREAVETLARKGCEIQEVSAEELQKASLQKNPQDVLAVFRQRPAGGAPEHLLKEQLCLGLDGVQDPGNLGTMIRTGEGAGITGVIMNNQTVDIFNPKTIRATMGSIFRVPFVYVPDLAPVLEQMHAKGIYTYAAHLKGQEYYDSFSFREPTAFLIGNEGNGLSKEISDQAGQYLKIPMEGRVESLNASIAAALLMYEAHRQRSARL